MSQPDYYVPRFWKLVAVLTYALLLMSLCAATVAFWIVFLSLYVPSLRWHDGTTHTVDQHLTKFSVSCMAAMTFIPWNFCGRELFYRLMVGISIPATSRVASWFLDCEIPPPIVSGWRIGLFTYLRSPSKLEVPAPSVSVAPSPPPPLHSRSYYHGRLSRFSDN
jgi:hypothetical protein